MSLSRHAQIKETYLRVCDFEETKAKQFLEEICSDDDELREEVLSLLSYRSPATIALEGVETDLHKTQNDNDKKTNFVNIDVEAGRWLGRRLGKYEITSVLGIGGMGMVFEAYDKSVDRHVAVKVLHSYLVDSESMRLRFLDEARAAGRLNHPNVVLIYEADDEDDIYYLVMEYVGGGCTSRQLQRNGTYSVAEATRILDQACQGLGAAHAQGLVHRDIKPANLLLTRDGTVKVSDFGIAKLTDQKSLQRTEVGQLVGTPHYMSPEQCEEGTVDARSDIYALGGTYYSLLVGRSPFDEQKSLLGLMKSHGQASRPNSCVVDPAIPPICQAIIEKAMAISPADRYQTVDELRLDLEQVPVALEEHEALPTSGVNTLSKSAVQSMSSSGKLFRKCGMVLVGLVFCCGIGAFFFSGGFSGAAVVPLTEINIVYGTEKQAWLKWAAAEYKKTEAGKQTRINLVGMGSIQSGKAVLDSSADQPIHVWSPASSAFREVLEKHWQKQSGEAFSPILKSANLVLSPMVFLIWKDRYEAMIKKYGKLDFLAINEAMQDDDWSAESEITDWGQFKFGHTSPRKSNSGMLTLAMLAYDYSEKRSNLTLEEVNHLEFHSRLHQFEERVTRVEGKLSASTGTLAKEMIFWGPSRFDCIMVYENLAITNIHAARGRWGELKVVYPALTIWNENPYYILDVPWSSEKQRAAAESFLDFLLSDRIQKAAVERGFRSGNVTIPVNYPESPFVIHADQGLRINVTRSAVPPSAQVLERLLEKAEAF